MQVAVAVHDWNRAARLSSALDRWGAIFELTSKRGPLRDVFEQTIHIARKQLEEAKWALRADEGRATTLDEVIQHAKEVVQEER